MSYWLTTALLVLRFFTFYPSQQKVLAPGHRVRVFGDVREGHLGLEMVHPQFKVVTVTNSDAAGVYRATITLEPNYSSSGWAAAFLPRAKLA